MKRRFLYVLVLVIVTLPLTAQRKAKLRNHTDSLSYMLGVSMYQGAQQFQLDLDYDMVAKGFLAAADSNAVVDGETANNYLRRISEQAQTAALDKTKEEGRKFLEENRQTEGIVETESGLQYRVIEKGQGASPSADDEVVVHYT